LCILIGDLSKSLSNAVIEPRRLALALPVAALLRVALGYRSRQWVVSAALMLALCAAAIAVYWFTGPLPE